MNLLMWLVRLVFFLAVLWIAVKNTTLVPVRLSNTIVWNEVPLIVVMLACLLIGIVAGIVALLPRLIRQQRQRGVSARRPAGNEPALPDRLIEAARRGGAVGNLEADRRRRG